MHLPLLLLAAVAAVIVAIWSWLGAPVAMPAAPLASGGKLHCVSYAPFRGRQSPLWPETHIPAAQIEQDLAQLAAVTDCVRTYSTEHGLDQVPAIAERHGLSVMQGIWLGSDARRNRLRIEETLALAKRHPKTIRSVIVGNEVLLRGEMGATDLAAVIREVKAAVAQPVTYADVWEFWLRYRDLYAAVDFVTIHILPYWEDFPIPAAQAGAHVDRIRAHVAEIYPDKPILIGETGWPSTGRMREGALPSPANQARVMHDVLARARAGGYDVNLIEAYDQPWKRALEGTVGGYWGLIDDAGRAPKFAWGQPVTNHPHWLMQAGGGVAFALVIFAAGWWAGRKAPPPGAAGWLGIAAIAAGAGLTVGLAAERLVLESLGIGGWMRSAALGLVALAAPPIAAAALGSGTALPSFARLLGGTEGRPREPLALAATAALVLLALVATHAALGLVFDPRYKDFPYHALTGPVVAFVMLAFLAPRPPREFGAAERAFAALLALSAVYIAFNEGFANWQAQWLAALFALMALTLLRISGVRRKG